MNNLRDKRGRYIKGHPVTTGAFKVGHKSLITLLEELAFKDCWCLANLQPLEKNANRKKSDNWVKSKPLL